jgi:UDP:flavonoid glycosyltransferase YjiC (YdhE family)
MSSDGWAVVRPGKAERPQMARIVLTTLGSAGDLNPFLALGLGLRARGHAVAFAVEDAFRPALAAAGFPIHRLSGDSVAMLAPYAEAMFGGVTPVASLRILLDHYLIPTLPAKIAELRAACEGADLLVAAAAQLAAGTVADLTGIRWATVALTPVTLPSSRIESQPAPVPLPAALQRASNRLSWTLGSLILRRMADAPVNRVRAGFGLLPRRDVFWLGNASPQLTCLACSPAFQPPEPDWPPFVRVTGFCFWDTPAEWAPAPELAAFLERPGPIVAVTAGSIAPSVAASFAPFYRASVAAIRRAGARALLVGAAPDELDTGADDDALALPFAPYSHIFPRCAVVIHHGGIGTAAQCLRYGVPSLVVPWGVDQFYTGGRLTRLRAGLTLARRRYTPDRAADALARLIHDPAFARAARAIRQQIAREDGVHALCDALEGLLSASDVPPTRRG